MPVCRQCPVRRPFALIKRGQTLDAGYAWAGLGAPVFSMAPWRIGAAQGAAPPLFNGHHWLSTDVVKLSARVRHRCGQLSGCGYSGWCQVIDSLISLVTCHMTYDLFSTIAVMLTVASFSTLPVTKRSSKRRVEVDYKVGWKLNIKISVPIFVFRIITFVSKNDANNFALRHGNRRLYSSMCDSCSGEQLSTFSDKD